VKLIRHLNREIQKEQVVATIGNFDGLHLGHQELLKQVTEVAQDKNYKSLLISFEPHPGVYFNRTKRQCRIISLKNKIRSIRNHVDLLLLLKFNQQMAQMPATEFIRKILLDYFDLKCLVVGSDFKFGHNKFGNVELLAELATKHHFELRQIPEKSSDNIKYSSSHIRSMLERGEVKNIANYLGYNYYITGRVIKGDMVARTFGYPTANIKLHQLCRPKYGVYSARVIIDGKIYRGMANLGTRPTLDGYNELLEINIFDYSSNLYDKEIKVELLDYIRDEIKFNNIEDLIIQIKQDEQKIRNLQLTN
jgi:riboflavin kinase/FMN adenylyltransferase